MSKCYQRQQTARGTIRPNVHPETHQRCVVSQRGSGREDKAATVADSKNGSANSLLHTLCHCSRVFSFFCKSNALHRFSWLQRRMTERCQSNANAQKTSVMEEMKRDSVDSLPQQTANQASTFGAWSKFYEPDGFSCFWKMPDGRYAGALLDKT